MDLKGYLPKDEFLELIKTTRLPSIDLIIFDEDNRILLGKRMNRPAKGFHFVPGGRIFQGETEEAAFQRISEKELGIIIPPEQCIRMEKEYKHDYEDNMFGVVGIGTHYDPIAYVIHLSNTVQFKNDDQHASLQWWTKQAALESNQVHPYTKDYVLDAL